METDAFACSENGGDENLDAEDIDPVWSKKLSLTPRALLIRPFFDFFLEISNS